MVRGNDRASDIDPYAAAPIPDNEWVVTGPHLRLMVADERLFEASPTDPRSGTPYVMWRGIPLSHVMPAKGDVIHMLAPPEAQARRARNCPLINLNCASTNGGNKKAAFLWLSLPVRLTSGKEKLPTESWHASMIHNRRTGEEIAGCTRPSPTAPAC